jgi:LmbE family N-acetylglucosaminyl deacetylase
MESPERLLVISPHLDDAVLSCGLLLAAHPAPVVCTVFSAAPEENMVTDWDQSSGFADAFEAMQARKAEDARALALLGAFPIHLAFRDAQYKSPPSQDALVAALRQAVREVKPSSILIPMGLFHSDHTMVTNACLAVMQQFEPVPMLAYEDVPYRKIPGAIQNRLRTLTESGFIAQPADRLCAAIDARHHQLKQAAINAYQSQLRAFGPDAQASLDSPERYWRLLDIAGYGTACHARTSARSSGNSPIFGRQRI